MIYDHIEFHNVEELRELSGEKGLSVQRVPEDVRVQLSERGQEVIQSPVANVELRFLLDSDYVDITLSSDGPEPLRMFVGWGGFLERGFHEIDEKPKTIRLEMHERYKEMDADHCKGSGYPKNLVRLMFAGLPTVKLYYHGVDKGLISAPSAKDRPVKTLLTYGTSITQGGMVTGPHLTYPYQTAHNLGMDLLNLGFSGAAMCEKAIVDHIASRQDWDIATLALSVNMYNNFGLDVFKRRAEYMVNTIAKSNPHKPIFCITLYPFFDDLGVYDEGSQKNADGYRQALRDIVEAGGYDYVHLLEGDQILTDTCLLSPDLIHPNDLGMIQMGRNLADLIQAKLLD